MSYTITEMPVGNYELLDEDIQRFERLPAAKSKSIADLIPRRTEWELLVYRTPSCWAFDMDEYGVKSEALVGGTEKALDYWFTEITGRLPSLGDKMNLTVFTEGEHEYDTKLIWLNNAEIGSGNDYLDVYSRLDCWLCPFLQALFKDVPEVIYLRIDPVSDYVPEIDLRTVMPYINDIAGENK